MRTSCSGCPLLLTALSLSCAPPAARRAPRSRLAHERLGPHSTSSHRAWPARHMPDVEPLPRVVTYPYAVRVPASAACHRATMITTPSLLGRVDRCSHFPERVTHQKPGLSEPASACRRRGEHEPRHEDNLEGGGPARSSVRAAARAAPRLLESRRHKTSPPARTPRCKEGMLVKK